MERNYTINGLRPDDGSVRWLSRVCQRHDGSRQAPGTTITHLVPTAVPMVLTAVPKPVSVCFAGLWHLTEGNALDLEDKCQKQNASRVGGIENPGS